MNFWNKLLGQTPSRSRDVAKERLQVVLVQDRVKLTPNIIEALRDEIIDVIAKYVYIDVSATDITVSRNSRQNWLVANIPILGAKREIQ